MRLEGLASRGNAEAIDLEIQVKQEKGQYIIDTSKLIVDIIDLLKDTQNSKQDIAAKFQIEMGRVFANTALKLAKENDVDLIGVSGGVAYNKAFSQAIKTVVEKEGLKFLEHHLVAPGDAGISTGQLIGGLIQYGGQ